MRPVRATKLIGIRVAYLSSRPESGQWPRAAGHATVTRHAGVMGTGIPRPLKTVGFPVRLRAPASIRQRSRFPARSGVFDQERPVPALRFLVMSATSEWVEMDVLVTVKAYPSISQTYGEAICVAGVRIDT